MDLDDVLEDLLKGAWKRARRAGRRRSTRRVLVLAASLGLMLVFGLSAAVAGIVLTGLLRTLLVVGLLALALVGVAGLLWAWQDAGSERRATARQARRRRRRRAGRSRGGAPANDDVLQVPSRPQADVADLPEDVRADWRRLHQAQGLVDELAADGWIDPASLSEVDELVARLRRLLATDQRTAELGGRQTTRLRDQVGDLADLLVALADEAVAHQAEEVSGHGAAATLDQARERMVALRSARREVEDLERPTDRGSSSEATGPLG